MGPLAGIVVVGLIGWGYATITTRRRKRELELERKLEEEKVRAAELGQTKQLLEYYARMRTRNEEYRRQLTGRLLGAASLLSTVLFLIGFFVIDRQVEDEAERIKRGKNSKGVSFVVPFIDVHATNARVTWLGDKAKRPAELGSPYYLIYLGRSRDVAVLLACGRTTVLVPADDVAIDLLNAEGDANEASRRQLFTDLCVD
jgi:hypothetical protein